jgi:hypothetical protein
MYLGVFATLIASVLYTLNPVLLLAGVFIIAVHHRIVLADEQHMQETFGQAYLAYCRQVSRYLDLGTRGPVRACLVRFARPIHSGILRLIVGHREHLLLKNPQPR